MSAIPSLFVTAAEEDAEFEIAEAVESEIVLLKPLFTPALQRTASALLGLLRRVEGPLTPTSFVSILGRIQRGKGTGVLTIHRGQQYKKMIFREGLLSFAGSNDPFELIGQSFIRSGVASEADLAVAFELTKEMEVPIGQVLPSVVECTSDTIWEIAHEKLLETVLAVFSWPDAEYEYYSGGIEPSEEPFKASIRLDELASKGNRRMELSARLAPFTPADSVRFRVKNLAAILQEYPDPGSQYLASKIDQGYGWGELLLEMRGQPFSLVAQLLRWHSRGWIEVDDTAQGLQVVKQERARRFVDLGDTSDISKGTARAPWPVAESIDLASTEDALSTMTERALIELSTHSLLAAHVTFLQILQRAPRNLLAQAKAREIEERLVGAAWGDGIYPERVVALEMSHEEVDPTSLSSLAAFISRRLATQDSHVEWTVEQLVFVVPAPRYRILDAIAELRRAGLASVTSP